MFTPLWLTVLSYDYVHFFVETESNFKLLHCAVFSSLDFKARYTILSGGGENACSINRHTPSGHLWKAFVHAANGARSFLIHK